MDRPILFSGPMVRALLEGRKTQTRRAMKEPIGLWENDDAGNLVPIPRPYRAGDRLWVREEWRTESRAYDDLAPSDMGGEETVIYGADADWSLNKTVGRRRAGMHLPRWASRLSLPVTEVRVQRLQDITNEDCIAEGIPVHPNFHAPRTGPVQDSFARRVGLISHYGAEYQQLWDSLNKSRGYGWETNPWIVAITFTVERRNIDQPALAA